MTVATFLDLVSTTPGPQGQAGGAARAFVVPEGWRQGRGAWGGLLAGPLLHAAARLGGEGQRIRHASIQMLAAAAPGPALVTTEVIRAGGATTAVDLRLLGAEADADGAPQPGHGTLAHATVVLGRARAAEAGADGETWRTLEPPEALAAGSDATAVVPLGPPLAPEFLSQLEVRPVAGFPLTGEPDGQTLAWVRPRRPVGAGLDAASADVVLGALADAMWPATLVRLATMHPLATVGYALDLPGQVAPEALVDDEGLLVPLLHRGRLVAAREGYVTETRELWHPCGVLLSVNTQTVAVIR